MLVLLMLAMILSCSSGQESGSGRVTEAPAIDEVISALKPLCDPMQPPGPDDWLANKSEEGQTFAQYLAENPVRIDGERNKIYVQPLGKFSIAQQKILDLAARFLGDLL